MNTILTQKGAGRLKVILGIFLVGAVMVGGAIMYGRMDTGVIDVSATISKANTSGEFVSNDRIQQPAAAVFQAMPNGGLVGKGDEGTPPPPPPQVESAGTTTEAAETASSTSTGGGEGTGAEVSDETRPVDSAPEAQ